MSLSLHHPSVRDLCWAINGPTLFNAPEFCQWQDTSDWFSALLQQLDQQPAPLLQHLQHNPATPIPPDWVSISNDCGIFT
ncbi:hypothetical protein LH51_12585 [Nitrincola sp. A-D6]|uniref:DUF1853 family protein n=1 Tax=Nitrincola sp. A-D6 TaxID=1545442 RepID=UPI00051FD5BE|nr:DUF1853 family protein [Nitrincola sp. A-D6]KGK41768.1 hypothetical protein LH51_12585 [Nitrincola sp. A-D6]